MLLNGNVGFLAIQSVDGLDTKLSSAAQIASYLSIVASVGSILLGLLLRRQTKNKVIHKVDDVVSYASKLPISYLLTPISKTT